MSTIEDGVAKWRLEAAIAIAIEEDRHWIKTVDTVRRWAYRWENCYAEASGLSSEEALAKVESAAKEIGLELINGPEEHLVHFTNEQSTMLRILPKQ